MQWIVRKNFVLSEYHITKGRQTQRRRLLLAGLATQRVKTAEYLISSFTESMLTDLHRMIKIYLAKKEFLAAILR